MISVTLPDADFEAWREKARALLIARMPPQDVNWGGADAPDLFGAADAPSLETIAITAPRAFIDVARKAVLHRDPERFALLYRVLWRLQSNRGLMEDAADSDIARIEGLAKAVRRDVHKMHAFVRFREVATEDGARFVAWFEPQHHILAESAPFFARRFASMRWSIVTPEASVQWDGQALAFGPGGSRADAPAEDARDADWRIYYRSMFNPARLKVQAMTREMPKHYWRNLPEARNIPSLIRSASAREDAMIQAAPTHPRKRAGAAHAAIAPEELPERLEPVAAHEAPPRSLADIRKALPACRACPLWKDATQAVPGEGDGARPLLFFVGEQPGDQEDLAGRPFVGPAGQVLNRALEAAGIERKETYVTNAVKHFKHEPRGKRRIHKTPNAGEVSACRWWLDAERRLVRPKVIVALGGTAALAVFGRPTAVGQFRQQAIQLPDQTQGVVTYHPSYLLRLPDPDAKKVAYAAFVADLTFAWGLVKASAPA